ncbi:MAG TPA: hypothetical protein VF483_04385 [Gemmatimonadaceae bacterium]
MTRQALTLVAAVALTLAAAGCNKEQDKSTTPKSGPGDSMTKPGTPSTPPSSGAPGSTTPTPSSPPSGTPPSSTSPMSPEPSGTPEKKGNP